jgi:hypothetical protein
MTGRNKAARILATLGSIVLFASAALHCAASSKLLFPALSASNLNMGLQTALKVVFLSVGWHWIVIAVIVLMAAFTETKLRKPLVLFCGLALLLEAIFGAMVMGLFIGNEMIGTAAILIVCGGLLFENVGNAQSASHKS